jgi:hypothetical protein
LLDNEVYLIGILGNQVLSSLVFPKELDEYSDIIKGGNNINFSHSVPENKL